MIDVHMAHMLMQCMAATTRPHLPHERLGAQVLRDAQELLDWRALGPPSRRARNRRRALRVLRPLRRLRAS